MVVVTKVIIATWVHQVPHNTNVAMRNTFVPWVRGPRVPGPRKNEHCGCIPVPEEWNVTPMLPFTVNALPIRLKVHIRVIPMATIDSIPMLICPLGGWRRLVLDCSVAAARRACKEFLYQVYHGFIFILLCLVLSEEKRWY